MATPSAEKLGLAGAMGSSVRETTPYEGEILVLGLCVCWIRESNRRLKRRLKMILYTLTLKLGIFLLLISL